MNAQRTHAIVFVVGIFVLSIVGVLAGSPSVFEAESFGDVLRAFASDTKTKSIFAFILVDVMTGVIAALRVGIFDVQRLSKFYASNVLPYLLGYLLYWCVALIGVTEFLPAEIGEGLAALGYGAIMTTLIGSTIDNLRRARDGSTPPNVTDMANSGTGVAHG